MASQTQLLNQLLNLKKDFDKTYQDLKIDDKKSQFANLEQQLADPNLWNNPINAQKISQQASQLTNEIEPWLTLKVQISDYRELLEITDDDWLDEAEKQIKQMEKTFAKLAQQILFTGKYDSHDVIMRLTSGVGGLDAQDWTEMLERMYLRFASDKNLKVINLERQASQEAGVKTSVLEISGTHAYGLLKSEHGVHRLVRRSPFNGDNLRQTSFALVEVLPTIEDEDLEINPNDLKIDYFRAGGHGGQSVNTTDSAVRITHLPTNTVVKIQNERSQIQNKATAMMILKAELLELQAEQNAEDLNQLKAGESASWGSQIRNYVFDPYTLVKDTRTKYQETDINKVLDGTIDGFIESYLKNCNN